LVDTNILARLVVRDDPLRAVVKAAIRNLKAQAAVVRLAPQSIIE
jgi:predicted nucleic acid-binding protein